MPAQHNMSHALRAAISSACIFPGAGLFMLRQYWRGCIFALPAALVIIMLFKSAITTALQINAQLEQQVQQGNFNIDLVAIYQQLHSALFASPYWQEGKWLLLASWLLSIASSYFVGKKIDLQQPAEGNQ